MGPSLPAGLPMNFPTTRTLALLVLGLGLPVSTPAQVAVKDPWVRATVPGQRATGAFMTLTAATAQTLIDVRSAAARTVELHEIRLEDGVRRMRAIPSLALPAGQLVTLSPSGHHVMLIDIGQELNPGQMVTLTLTFEGPDRQRRSIDVQAPVRPLNARPAEVGSGGPSGPAVGQGASIPPGIPGLKH